MCAAIAAAVLFCQNPVHATPLTVTNPIFSSPLVTYGQTAQPVVFGVPGWSAEGAPVAPYGFNANVIIWPNHTVNDPDPDLRASRVDNLITDTVTQATALAQDSNPLNWWFGYDATQGYQACASIASANDGLVQSLSSSFQANKSYSLTVAVGHNYGSAPDPLTKFTLALFYTDAGVDHIVSSLNIFNDSTTALSATHLKDFSTPLTLIDPAPASLNKDAIGKAIGIRLSTDTPSNVTPNGLFNVTNIRVDEVPEPASLAIMLLGSTLLLRRRRT